MKTESFIERRPDFGIRAVLIAVFLCLVPWLAVQINMRVPDDAAWLFGAADLFLSGAHMTESFFDNNPPMSYMIYIPAVLLSKAGIAPWYSLTIYALGLVFLSVFLVVMLIRAWPGVGNTARMGAFARYLISITLVSQYEFGQKDHLIAVTLFPFLLAQFALADRHSVSSWIILTALAVGTPFILLKPHYGLLPVIMIAHRLIREKNMVAVLRPDVAALFAGVMLYGAAVLMWFPDYIHIALPDTIALYAAKIFSTVFMAAAGPAILSGCLLIFSFFLCQAGDTRRIAVFLAGMALAAIVPLFVQMKGFSLHMLPVLSLMLASLLFIAGHMFEEKYETVSRLPVFFVVTVLGFAYALFPPGTHYATHKSYMESGLAQYLREKKPEGGFFMESHSTTLIASASMYSGVRMSSRFPSLWFLPFPTDPEKAVILKEKFGGFIAADLEKFKPGLVAVYASDRSRKSFVDIFGGQDDFDRAWRHYRRGGKFILDYDEGYRSTPFRESAGGEVAYDIYVRVRD